MIENLMNFNNKKDNLGESFLIANERETELICITLSLIGIQKKISDYFNVTHIIESGFILCNTDNERNYIVFLVGFYSAFVKFGKPLYSNCNCGKSDCNSFSEEKLDQLYKSFPLEVQKKIETILTK